MAFDTTSRYDPLDMRHRAERQAADAPGFLRRDTDAGRAMPPPQKGDILREIPLSRATADMVYQLDEQAQLIQRLYERLDGALEAAPCDPEQPSVDSCGYTNSALVVGLAHHANRVRIANRQLIDILARLAI